MTKRPGQSDKMRWFHQGRFGIFVHFGLYSLLERGEWVMFQERIPAARYARLAERFNPVRFDADAWANLAVQAGAKYMVLTSRHHDGFCLFDSRVSDFTSAKTAAGRDFVAEFVVACRRAGLKVGLYYSLLDWRFPGYFEPFKHHDSAAAMKAQCHAQVRELLTNYGRIDHLWWDGGWITHGRYQIDKAAFWDSGELDKLIRSLQPHILCNERYGLPGDFDTPEQVVLEGRGGRATESCMTMGDACGWGYIRHNPNIKPLPQLLQHLVKAAAGAGNFLLNVGPKGDGAIRKPEADRLRAMGAWLKVYGEGIYGSQRCELNADPISFNMIGPWTRKGHTGYWHIFRWPGREAVQSLVATKALSAELLGAKTRAKLSVRQEHNGRLVIGNLPPRPPHPYVNVIKVTFAGQPQTKSESADMSAWLEGKA